MDFAEDKPLCSVDGVLQFTIPEEPLNSNIDKSGPTSIYHLSYKLTLKRLLWYDTRRYFPAYLQYLGDPDTSYRATEMIERQRGIQYETGNDPIAIVELSMVRTPYLFFETQTSDGRFSNCEIANVDQVAPNPH